MINQRKIGIILSYAGIVLNSVINIFFTPFLLKTLGPAEYGLYQIINAFAAYLLIADLGTGTLLTRFLSKYLAEDDKKGQANYIAFGLIITTICSFLIGILGIVLYSTIDNLFKESLTTPELAKAKSLYVLLIVNIAVSIIKRAFYGIVAAYEKHIFLKFLNIGVILLRVIGMVVLLNLGYDSFAIILTDLFLTIINLLVLIFYSFSYLKIKVKYYGVDSFLFWDSMKFIFAVFLQLIVVQINNNVDRVLLGIMTDTSTVALYSIAMVIFTSYNIIANAAVSVYLPYITREVTNGADGKKLTDIIILPGRVNFMICGAILTTLALFGDDFVTLWVGDEYKNAWIIALILMVPYTVPFIQNVKGSILDAKNKRLFSSLIIIFITIFNITLTVYLVKEIGYLGAPIATAIAVLIGYGILMNIYYKKVIGLEVGRFFSTVFKGTLPSLIIAAIFVTPLLFIKNIGWVLFILECFIFLIVFFVFQYFLGFNSKEKAYVQLIFGKILSKTKIINPK
jgi:O-antigen/teichoic acid export membrane protein